VSDVRQDGEVLGSSTVTTTTTTVVDAAAFASAPT
jgi:hypothetical protein